ACKSLTILHTTPFLSFFYHYISCGGSRDIARDGFYFFFYVESMFWSLVFGIWSSSCSTKNTC
ncbi:hypothetical protein FRX31_010550, partial [Thalictrum thalictroides]